MGWSGVVVRGVREEVSGTEGLDRKGEVWRGVQRKRTCGGEVYGDWWARKGRGRER